MATNSFLLAESSDAAVCHHLHPVHGLHIPFVNRSAGSCSMEQMWVESAIGHSPMKAADGPYTNWEGFFIQ